MKNIKNNIGYLMSALFIASTAISCDEGGEPDPGGTSVEMYAGDWYISLSDSNGESVVDHALHSTYNTSANDNTFWIDDAENGYYIKSKVTVNLADGTFNADNADNLLDGSHVTITEGKIIKNGGISKGGHVVDSIYFRAHFDYDAPGYDIIYGGHKRTGFLEDEY